MSRYGKPLAAPSAFDTGAYSEGPLGATWPEHVKAYAAKHGLTYGQAMSAAGASWRKQKGGALKYMQYGAGCGLNPSTNYCKKRPGDDDMFCSQGAKRCQKKKGSGAPKGIRKSKK